MKTIYRPFSMVIGVFGGILAGVIFKRLWATVSKEDEPPTATRADQSWSAVLAAAALEGALYACVKAALDRGGAVFVQRVTGVWPGEGDS